MNIRQQFLQYNAQTSPAPLLLEVAQAEGVYITDTSGKQYIDLISGISVCNMGHGNQAVLDAIAAQSRRYMHTMVYGEFVQTPQTAFATALVDHLPEKLNCVYFTNSGSEATEGAMKLAKRVTARSKFISFNNSYHGSTQGALSIMGSEYFRNAFRPLLPEVYHFNYNDDEVLYSIDHNTAAVVVEMVQAESGVHPADPVWMMALKERCETAGALLIADEIQTGFGRTGTLFAFEQYGITPDILLLGKALGSGLPLGAFIASKDLMDTLSAQPVLGHITTFGGNPVCCAAGLAGFQELSNKQVINSITQKQELFRTLLTHPRILAFRFAGLMMAIQFENESFNQKIIQSCLHRGLITDWFLFAPDCLRIAPPLIISDEDIRSACRIILESIDEVIR
ncbi:MAG: aspartate aminotransferase family protein [Bacteroidota bacterium]|jgi:acetylornithine/succinyldiaminopimelate/putrescine aminotransferase